MTIGLPNSKIATKPWEYGLRFACFLAYVIFTDCIYDEVTQHPSPHPSMLIISVCGLCAFIGFSGSSTRQTDTVYTVV